MTIKQKLTPRRYEFALLVSLGLSNKEIATRLDVTVNWVKKMIQIIQEITGIHNRVRLATSLVLEIERARVNEILKGNTA